MFRPVRMLARHGEHLGLEVKQFSKSTPSLAMRSKAGVCTQLQPYAPAWGQPQSSAIAKRIFGRLAWPAAGQAAAPAIVADSISLRVMLRRIADLRAAGEAG